MEIGYVKQAFNNEIIRMKPSFLRAKVQSINKLIKKSKVLRQKSDQDNTRKIQTKAEQMINEVFIMKKLKTRDIAEFILKNNENIQHFLNSPIATKEKAIGRLVTHKCLLDKVIQIKEKFLNMPVDLLLAPGKRQLLKQEKNKSAINKTVKKVKHSKSLTQHNVEWIITDNVVQSDANEMLTQLKMADDIVGNADNNNVSNSSENNKEVAVGKFESIAESTKSTNQALPALKKKKKVASKQTHKLPEKKLKRKLPILEEEAKAEPVGVDSFFLTESGDNYETLVEKRVEEPLPQSATSRGNRKMRRALLFGRPIPYPSSKNRNNGKVQPFKKPERTMQDKPKHSIKSKKTFKSKADDCKSHIEDVASLHPSWQAKKMQSNILEFKGKKVVFDD